MSSTSSIGIYFDRHEARLVSLRGPLANVAVDDCISIPMPDGGTRAALGEEVEGFIRRHMSGKTEIHVGLPREETILAHLDLPSPTEENLRSVLGYELDSYTPYSKEEAYFAFQVAGRDPARNVIKVLLAVVTKERLDAYMEALGEFKDAAAAVETSSTALSAAFLYGRDDVSGRFVFLNANEDIAEVVLFENGLPHYSRSFDKGAGGGEGGGFTAAALSEEIGRGLRARGWPLESLKEIIVKGNFAGDTDGTVRELEADIGKSVSRLSDLPVGPDGAELSAAFMAPLGLALRGISGDMPPFDLMSHAPAVGADRREYLRLLPLAAVAALLLLAVILTPLLRGQRRLDSVTASIERLLPEIQEVAALRDEIAELEHRRGQLTSMLDSRPGMLNILKEFTRVVPDDTWLTELKYKDDAVEISGYSQSASALIALLESSAYFTGVRFSGAVTVTGAKAGPGMRGPRRPNVFLDRAAAGAKGAGKDMDRFKIKAVLEVAE